MQAVLHSQAACAFCPAERRASWTARPASPKDWRSLCRDRCFPPAKTSVPRLEDGSPVPGRPYPVLSFSHEPGRKTCFPPRKRTAWRARAHRGRRATPHENGQTLFGGHNRLINYLILNDKLLIMTGGISIEGEQP